jgi:hypothetical protein
MSKEKPKGTRPNPSLKPKGESYQDDSHKPQQPKGDQLHIRDDSDRGPAISQRCGGGRRVMRKRIGGE